MSNPWLEPSVAIAQRELVDRQLQEWRPGSGNVPHFDAMASAVLSTRCPGSLLDHGCGSGYGREILDRAGVPYSKYEGWDISGPALEIAAERYPESKWYLPSRERMNEKFDVVLDTCALMHMDDWKDGLAKLCSRSRRHLILHRIPVSDNETSRTTTTGYGQTFQAWSFWREDIDSEMAKHGFVKTATFPADGGSSTIVYARPRHFVSYADGNYLTRLKAMHSSMLRHCGPFVLHVLAWDDAVLEWALHDKTSNVQTALRIDTFLRDHPDLAIGKLPGPPRTRIEHMWTVGPRFIADVMESTGEPVTYVDADILFHSSPEPVFAEIGGAPAGFVPHSFAPASAGLPGPTRETHEVFGKFNVGVVHIVDRGIAALWADAVREWCYDRLEATQTGVLYGDQKMLEQYHRWNGAVTVQHPGAAPGPWCIHTRALDIRDGVIHFGGRPLVAFHYSSLKLDDNGEMVQASRPEYQVTQRQGDILWKPYLAALAEASRG